MTFGFKFSALELGESNFELEYGAGGRKNAGQDEASRIALSTVADLGGLHLPDPGGVTVRVRVRPSPHGRIRSPPGRRRTRPAGRLKAAGTGRALALA